MRELLHSDLTGEIIGAAIEVHKAFGPGFLEKVYEKALCVELELQGINFEQQAPFVIEYRGRIVGEYKADIIVDRKVIVEVKAVGQVTEAHKAQALNYLAAAKLRVALVLNFGEGVLKPVRVIP